MTAYSELINRLRDVHDLRLTRAVLEWDQQTYMPPKGNEARTRQVALLATLAHQKLCDERLGGLLEECGADPGLSAEQRALVREARRDRDKAVRVPSALVKEIADTSGHSLALWSEARAENNFSKFASILDRLIGLKKQEARALGFAAGGELYDALLDCFEPGATVKNLDGAISRTRDITVAATRAIAGSRKKPDVTILERSYPEGAQEELSYFVLEKMGYDLQAGRLDRSVHPFTTNFDVDDVRITTRYLENWLPSALFGTIHEAGHALYEQGLPKQHAATPLAEAVSMGLHESQSRLWENQIGRSRPFWDFLFPKAKELFSKTLGGVSLEDFYLAVNAVRPSMIRVEADEVTYNLHIVIRYELERAIFADELKAADLPEAWNQKMRSYLGMSPAPGNDSEGVLQDIHWSLGSFGYFPSYLLGNLYAAQWMHTMRRELPNLDELVAGGELLPIRKWLGDKIHRHGKLYPASELVRLVSGEELNPSYFETYLKGKFGPLYEITW